MDLTRILMLCLQGASIDTPLLNKDSPPAPPKPADPVDQIKAQAVATPSTYSPFGSAVYSGDPTGKDPNSPYRLDVNLSPEEQALYDKRSGVATALLGRGTDTLSTIPVGYSFNGATDPTTNKFFAAQKALLDPVWDKESERLDQKLANQGLPTGSDGNESAADYERSQFEKSRGAAYEQAAANALGTGFNQDIATRQQNLNEVAQALGGSQLTPVGGAGGTGGGIDTSGAFANQAAGVNRQYQGQLAGYNADVSNTNTGIGAAAAIAAAFI